MSLQVWLPFTKDYENKGMSDLKFTMQNTSTTTYPQWSLLGGNIYWNTSFEGGGLVSDKEILLGNQITMCCWVYVSSFTSASNLGGGMGGQHRYATCTGMGLTFRYVDSTHGYLSVNTGDGSNRTYNTYGGNTLLHANQWYHVCFTYDGSTIRFYLNGNFDGSHAYTGQKNVLDKIVVGAWSLASDQGYDIYPHYKLNGGMNDFRIYNEVLSPKEIREIAKGLMVHYQFKQPRFQNLVREYFNIYSNFAGEGVTSSLVETGETYKGHPVYRLTQTPTSGRLSHFQTALDSHGVYIDYTTFNASTKYAFWLYYRPISHSNVRVGGTASNIAGWTEIPPEAVGDGWYRVGQYRNGSATVTKGDRIYTSYYCPTAAAGTPIIIEFCAPFLVANTSSVIDEQGIAIDNNIEPDVSGNENHAIVSDNTVVPIIGGPRYKNSCYFGGNGYLTATKNFNEISVYTFSWWSKHPDMGGRMAWGFSGGNRLNVYPSGGNFYWNTGDSQNNPFKDDSGNLVSVSPYNGGWHHYAVASDGVNDRLYIDGVYKGKALSHRNLPASQLIISGWAADTGYKWNGGSISDFRIYSAVLSHNEILELYNSTIALTKTQTLIAGDFIEKDNQAHFAKSGKVCAEGFVTSTAPVSDMKTKVLGDGSKWARIFHHRVKDYQRYWAESEVPDCNTAGKYSKMGLVDKFKDPNGKYEFMLTYPNINQYCPAGFELLECIETDGNQYINTGVTTEGSWEFDIHFTSLGTRQLMGYNANGANYWGINENGKYETYYHSTRYAGSRDQITYTWSGGNVSLLVDDQNLTTTSSDRDSSEFTLFRITPTYSGLYCKCKLYRCKYWNGTTLQRDFIPVKRKTDGVIGLYDLVNKVFYTNAGTGTFKAWSRQEYIPVDYIDAFGSQYIDTEYSAPEGFKFEGKIARGNTDTAFIGAHYKSSPYGRNYINLTNRGWDLGTGDSCPFYEALIETTTSYVIKGSTVKGNSYLNVNGTRLLVTADSSTRSSDTLRFFSSKYHEPSSHTSGRIYWFKIYDKNDKLVRDFIPVISTSTGEAGLFDLVTLQFYGSNTGQYCEAGTGKKREYYADYDFLEYIQSTGTQSIDTGVSPNANTHASIEFSPTGSMTENGIMGSSWSASGFFLMMYQNRIRWHARGNVLDLDTTKNLNRYRCHCATSYIKVNDIQTNMSVGGSADSTATIKLFNIPYQSYTTGSFKLYYCDIWNGSTLQRSLQPVRRISDGIVGLLDLVNGGFYQNTGSGSFVAGPMSSGGKKIEHYNRWLQTNSPNTVAAATGFFPKSMSWRNRCYGLVKFHSQGTTTYTTDQYNGTWYGAIGQRSIWSGGGVSGIPACNESAQSETELWVRYDKHPNINNLTIEKGNTISLANGLER